MAFQTTRWSLVVAAGEEAPSALSELAELYWYPLYAFARHLGRGEHEAQDLVQGFFALLLERGGLRAADPERGRFRTFLLTMFKRMMARVHEKERALKRGGGRPLLSLDFAWGEEKFRMEPAESLSPERLFERGWALTLLDKVLGELEAEYGRAGHSMLFAELRGFLAAGSQPPSQAEVADRLAMTSGALRVALHRLRARYRDLLRAEIAQTVADPADVNDEIRQLMNALA